MLGEISETGENITYAITVANQGDLFSGDFAITDVLAPGTTFVSASAGGVETEPGSGVVEWSITESLAPGATTTVTLTVAIDDATEAPFVNTAEISVDIGADDDSTPDATLVGEGSDNLVDITDVAELATDTNTNTPDEDCLLYTSPSPRDATLSRMPSSA